MPVVITSPADGAALVSANASVQFDVTGVSLGSVVVQIDSGSGFVTVYTGSAFVSPFSGSVVSDGSDHAFVVNHPAWSPSASIQVRVSEAPNALPLSASLTVDGLDDQASYGVVNDLNGQGAATWTVWVRQEVLETEYVFAESTTGSSAYWRISTNTIGNVRFEVYVSGIARWVETNTTPIGTGSWHNITVTYAAGAALIYVDGVEQTTAAFGTIPATLPSIPTRGIEVGGGLNLGSGDQRATLVSTPAYWVGVTASLAQVGEIYNGGVAADLDNLATLAAPDWWADLDGDADVRTGTGTPSLAGSPVFSAENPGAPSTSWSFSVSNVERVRYASAPPAGGFGLAGHGAAAHASAVVPGAPSGAPVVSNWCSQGVGWLLSQFHGQPRIEAVLCAVMSRAQEVEQALADVRDLFSLELASGALLSALGDAQGLPRSELPDPEMSDDGYRQALRAKAVADSAPGSTQDVLRTLMQFLGGTDLPRYSADFPAGFYVTLGNQHVLNEGRLMARLGRRAKPSGVRWHLRYGLRNTGLPTQTLAEVGGPVTQAMTEVGGSQIATMAEADEGR